MTLSAIALGLSRFQPDVITDANQFAQRLDRQRSLPKHDLDFGAVEIVHRVGGFQQALSNVALLVHPSIIAEVRP